MAIKLKVQDECPTRFALGDSVEMTITSNYEDLSNKPSINGVTLIGDKTTEDLGIQAGVTSWNGQTGDVVYTPPNYALTYDESVSVGSAVVGEAVTGEPNYTPTGTIQTTSAEVLTGGTVALDYTYSNYKLTISGITFTSTKATALTGATFQGTGVNFAIEQEN